MRTMSRYVEDLLRSRRPRGFRIAPEDTGVACVAIMLRAARPGGSAAREEFVTGLRARLAAEVDPPVPRRHGGRRTLLRVGTLAASAAVAGAGIDHALTRRSDDSEPPETSGPLTPDSGAWRPVLAGADLPEGRVYRFEVEGVMGFVQRIDGRLRAVSGICTHQGCRLVLSAGPDPLICPCHGAKFALDGRITWRRPEISATALPRLAVRESGGVIEVYAPRPG